MVTATPLADVMAETSLRGMLKQLFIDQIIINNDFRLLNQPQRFKGQ
jgi:hypothetical protein